MTDTRKILGIVGSYRKDGVIDSVVSTILAAAEEKGAETQKILLQDCDIRFCTNCRECAQSPGKHQPVLRDTNKRRDAIRIFGVSAMSSLHQFANLIGARVTGTIKVGLVNREKFTLPESTASKARRTGHRIAAEPVITRPSSRAR